MPAKRLRKCSDVSLFTGVRAFNRNCVLSKGAVHGVRVELIENLQVQKVRYLDKLIDELVKGDALEKILHGN